MRSTCACQAILTSLKTHQTNELTQWTPSSMKKYLLTPPQTPPMTPPPVPMEINKVYMIPAQWKLKMQKDIKWHQGLCHLCKGQGHIQCYCSKKVIEALMPIMHMKAATISPLVADQGLKPLCSPIMTHNEVLHYLKRQMPKAWNKLAAAIQCPTVHQDFYLA